MFEVKDEFYLNGEPFKIISGAVHYFRIVPEYWRDRLEKLVNMGCNTVETYIPWNFHEPKRGEFCWDGMRDVFRFLDIARELGLYVILRASPYICAEWEFGGLPAWLLADRNMRVRCSYKPYLDAVKSYYAELMPKLVPYQEANGGNIILMQLENEYGYYGNDTAYLEFLRDTIRGFGITVPFTTADGPWSSTLFLSGMVEGALPTGNFGSGAEYQFGQMRGYIGGDKPLMCMECWDGWFDNWGEPHHTTAPEKCAAELDEVLKRGSVNLYMFEGGTNFGFMNGRNDGGKNADITSYDYDSPLTEDGRVTEKYEMFARTIAKYRKFEPIPLSTEIKRSGFGEIKCSGRAELFSVLETLAQPVKSAYPQTMEEIGQSYGYILYRPKFPCGGEIMSIQLENAADRVICFNNGKRLFDASYAALWERHEFTDLKAEGFIDFLCENEGRENFGTNLDNQRKGIAGGVKINEHRLFGFDIFPLPLDEGQIAALEFGAADASLAGGAPAFFRFEFTADEPCDTFLDTEGFGRGCAFINGFNLGRFWDIGPQKRLYVSAPLIRKGANVIVIFETNGRHADFITLADAPDLG